MLVKTASPKFFAPVTLKQLDARGALKEVKFDAQFKRIKQTEFDALIKANAIKHAERNKKLAPIKKRAADLEKGLDVSDQLSDDACAQITDENNEDIRADFTELLTNYMTGWSGVQDEGQNPIAFTHAGFFEICDEYIGLLTAAVNAFYGSFSPTASAHLAAKN